MRISTKVEQADKTFDLVMVSERMPESLVLLRRLLCADWEDVVTLKLNARKVGFNPVFKFVILVVDTLAIKYLDEATYLLTDYSNCPITEFHL